jgi:hypothetical protein
MVAIPPPAIPFAQGEDVLMMRAVVHRTKKEVEDYFLHYKDQRRLVASLGTEQSKPENKPALEVLEMKELRLDVATCSRS